MSVKSCVTISLVKEARGGPFVFWDDLAEGCRQAAELGFDAVEVFPPSPDAVDPAMLHGLLSRYELKLAAVGTGAGWVIRKLTLTHPDAAVRDAAEAYVKGVIDFAGPFDASAIIGSMQGRWGDAVTKETAHDHLRGALDRLGAHAKQYGVPLIYEPLNRYETNIANTVADGLAILQSLATDNVALLADLFHMNIEETDLAAAIRTAGSHIGHVHFVDSNRRPAGCGHLDFTPIAQALRDIGYDRYASAEALPWPNSLAAALATMAAFRKFLA